MSSNVDLNVRPDYDKIITDIAQYVYSYKVESDLALETAKNCLIDTIGCGLLRVGIFRSSVGVALGECARCARIGAGADELGSERSRGFHAGLVEPFFLPVGSEERLLPAYRVEGGGESSAPTMKKRPRGERGASAGGGLQGVLTTNPRAPGLRTWRAKISASPIRRLERAQISPRRRSSGERVQKNGSSETAVLATKNCSS